MNDYPENWDEIALRIKNAAGWKCERCKHPNDRESGHVLTVHHLDGNKANCDDWNLAALCQRCHLKIQGRVRMDQLFMEEILDVSEWFKPHLQGYLQSLIKTTHESENRQTPAPLPRQDAAPDVVSPVQTGLDPDLQPAHPA